MWPLMPAAIFTQSSWVATTIATSLSKKSDIFFASASDTISFLSLLSGAGAGLSAFLSAAGLAGGPASAGRMPGATITATITARMAAVIPVYARIMVMNMLLRGARTMPQVARGRRAKSQQLVERDRQIADPPAGRVMDRVG